MGCRQEGSGRTRAPETAPNCRATAAPTAASHPCRGCWSSTSPRACSQAIRAPSPAGSRISVHLLAARQSFRHALAERVEPLAGQRRDRHDVIAARRFLRSAARAPRPPAGRSCSTPRSAAAPPPPPCPSDASTSSTSSRCASRSGCAMSRTWTSRSADATSSSVARNAAISSVGRSETNPTVSRQDRLVEARAAGCRAWSGRGSRTADPRRTRLRRSCG